jgi:MFS family permease
VLRILGVTALVSMIGGLAGAAMGVLASVAVLVLTRTWDAFWGAETVFLFATVVGFVIGGFLAPILTWLFLRRVPLWRASIETAFAATIGFAVGAVMGIAVPLAMASALTCSMLAALRLKRAYRPKQEALEAA